MNRPHVKEAGVQRAIMDYLDLRHIFHYRNNSGAFVFPETATHKRRFFKAGVVGAPDIVCVIKGQYIGIECKGTGGKQSAAQQAFQRELEEAGGLYVLAYDIDDVDRALALIPNTR